MAFSCVGHGDECSGVHDKQKCCSVCGNVNDVVTHLHMTPPKENTREYLFRFGRGLVFDGQVFLYVLLVSWTTGRSSFLLRAESPACRACRMQRLDHTILSHFATRKRKREKASSVCVLHDETWRADLRWAAPLAAAQQKEAVEIWESACCTFRHAAASTDPAALGSTALLEVVAHAVRTSCRRLNSSGGCWSQQEPLPNHFSPVSGNHSSRPLHKQRTASHNLIVTKSSPVTRELQKHWPVRLRGKAISHDQMPEGRPCLQVPPASRPPRM